jgi:hypothetical protein
MNSPGVSVSCNSIICQKPCVAANVALRTKSTTPVYDHNNNNDDDDDDDDDDDAYDANANDYDDHESDIDEVGN